jgi:hypothetical protein
VKLFLPQLIGIFRVRQPGEALHKYAPRRRELTSAVQTPGQMIAGNIPTMRPAQ